MVSTTLPLHERCGFWAVLPTLQSAKRCVHTGGLVLVLRCGAWIQHGPAGLSEEDFLLFGNCDSWAIYVVKFKQNQMINPSTQSPLEWWLIYMFLCQRLMPWISPTFTSYHPKVSNLQPVFLIFWEKCAVCIPASTCHRGIVWDPMPLHRDFRTSGRTKTRKKLSGKDQAAS